MRVVINALSVTHGGGRSYVLNLMRELGRDSRGFTFTVLAASGQLREEDTAGSELQVVSLPEHSITLRVGLRVLYEQLVLPLRIRRYDLLYCIADMAPVATTRPTVVLMSNLNVYDRRFYDNLRLRALNALTRLGLRRARRVVFPTEAAAGLIRSYIAVPDDRVAILPYGIEREAFEPEEPVGSDRSFLLIPAAIERHKNLGVAIESMRHLERQDLDLWLVGPTDTDPAYTEEMRRVAADMGVDARVRFVGAVPYRSMLGYYRGAAAVVFPSEIETFGLPILEAMLAGTPVVASDIPPFRELAGDAALYFPLHDARALAAAIERTLGDAGPREARRRLGRERAARFTWKKHADGLCALFREVISGS